MKIAALIKAMEQIAPTHFAEDWDNVGLITGDPDRTLSGPTLLTIDLTGEVVDEAIEMGAGAIVAYHPPIFAGLKTVTPASPRGSVLLRCIESGIAIYSPHTALDAAPGGVADWLLDQVGETTERRAISPFSSLDPNQTHKLVTFVPASAVESVREALACAGAGRIGEYSQCSWTTAGQGTFFGSNATNPAVGESGKLERIDEQRLEMVCPKAKLGAILQALKSVHPYDEPAFDVHELASQPDVNVGPGRVGTLTKAVAPEQIASHLKQRLKLDVVQCALANNAPVTRIAVCPGSGESLLVAAAALGTQLFVTGEMKHHEVLSAVERGMSIILAGHTETERGYLPTLAQRLSEIDPAFRAAVSQADRSPLRAM